MDRDHKLFREAWIDCIVPPNEPTSGKWLLVVVALNINRISPRLLPLPLVDDIGVILHVLFQRAATSTVPSALCFDLRCT